MTNLLLKQKGTQCTFNENTISVQCARILLLLWTVDSVECGAESGSSPEGDHAYILRFDRLLRSLDLPDPSSLRGNTALVPEQLNIYRLYLGHAN